MKRLFSLFLCILMLASICLMPATAYAAPSKKVTLTFSEDYSLLYTDSETFRRYDIALLSYNLLTLEENEYEAKFLAEEKNVKELMIDRSEDGLVYWAYITYRDGSTLSCGYLREDAIPLYNQLKNATLMDCLIDFEWPEDNEVATDFSLLSQEPAVILKEDTLTMADFYIVYLFSADPKLKVARGQILIEGGSYYYMDYVENEIDELYPYPGDFQSLKAHPIQDEALITQLETAANNFGGFFPIAEKVAKVIGIALLVLFFGVVPAGLFIFGLLLCFRSKKSAYRKIGISMLVPAGICLLVFLGLTTAILLL